MQFDWKLIIVNLSSSLVNKSLLASFSFRHICLFISFHFILLLSLLPLPLLLVASCCPMLLLLLMWSFSPVLVSSLLFLCASLPLLLLLTVLLRFLDFLSLSLCPSQSVRVFACVFFLFVCCSPFRYSYCNYCVFTYSFCTTRFIIE